LLFLAAVAEKVTVHGVLLQALVSARLILLVQDALLGRREGSIGKHALVVQLRELVQLRYPRRLVIRSHGRRYRRTDFFDRTWCRNTWL